jgi:hypothetical protein
MKITRRKLRRLIQEAIEFSHQDIVQYLSDRAQSYHGDIALDVDGDGSPDAGAIRQLLQDDFLDDIGHQVSIEEYEELIDQLSRSGPGNGYSHDEEYY